MDKLIQWLTQALEAFKKIGEDIKEIKNKNSKSVVFPINRNAFTKLFSVKNSASLSCLLKANNEISFAYIQNGEGLQENKTNVDYQLYSTIEIANKDQYDFQKIKQDNGTNFNLILGTKDITISAPSTSYRRYGFYIENSLKSDISLVNKYYTISMLITPNASDTQDTKFFSSIVIEKSWRKRIPFNTFNKVINDDGTIFLYSTFLLNRQNGEVFTEFGFICEGSTTNTTKITNLKVEEGQNYTPYIKAFSELSSDANGIDFPLKGIPGSLPLSIGGKYIHILYANDALGTGLSNSYEGKTYIGLYADENEAPSTQSSKYKWTLISSITNDIPCYLDDETYYLHFVYSSDDAGGSVSNTFGNPYIGYLLDKNLSSKEFNVYAKSLKTQQQLELSILSLDGPITFFEGVEESLDNALAFELLDSIPTLEETATKNNVSSVPLIIQSQKYGAQLYPGGISANSEYYFSTLSDTKLIIGGEVANGMATPLLSIDTENNSVESSNRLLPKAFTEWLGIQEKYDRDSLDWSFHSDLVVNGLTALKTGKQVVINAYFKINTTTETDSMILFKIPDVLKPDPTVQFTNNPIIIFRYATVSQNYLRSYELLTLTSQVVLLNRSFTGISDDLNDLNNCEFKLSLSYSME